jgi:TP901 family phage tail tape measure protein
MSNQLELKVVFAAVDKFLKPVNAITKGASAAAKAMRDNTAAMKDFNRTVERIDAFKKVEREAAITANAFAKNQRAVDALKASIAAAGVPTKAMSAELANLTRRSEELRQKHQSLINTEQTLFGKLKEAGIDTRNLAQHRQQLASASAAAANASTRLSAALEAENQKMKRLRAAQADLAKSRETASGLRSFGGKAMAGGAAINAAAAMPVIAYAKAEDAATQLKIAMMEKGGKVSTLFAQINDLAMKLGNKLPGTTADYQDMMTMLVRQGMPASKILGGLGEATAYLAVQLKMIPTAAAEFSSELQHATRTTDKDMMGLMDTIQKAFNLGVNQDHMLQGFAKMSPILSIIKKEGSEAAAVLAPLLIMAKNSGMAGEAAGNAYRKIFQMSLDKKKLAKGNALLAGTGVNLDFSNGKGEFGGLEQMYAQLEKLRSVNTQQRLAALKKVFGDDAETLQALTLMIEKGVDGYRSIQDKMESQAAIQDRVNAQLKTLKSLWDAATGTFTNVLVAFGESISPQLHATAEWLGTVAERTQRWAAENPGLAGTLMTIMKWLGLAVFGLGALSMAAGAILVPLAVMKFSLLTLGITGGGAFGMIATGIRIAGAALLTNPIGLTLTAIATAATLIYSNWDKIGPWFSGIIDGILSKFAALRDFIKRFAPSLFSSGSGPATSSGSTPSALANSPLIRPAGSSYQIAIHAAPGADNQELARLVSREIERIDARKAARARGTLRDTE